MLIQKRRFISISSAFSSSPVTTRGSIVALGVKWFHHHEKSIFEIILDDGTARLRCRWWNLPFMEKYFAIGDEVMVFGKVKSLKPRTIDHPDTEVLDPGEDPSIHLDRIVPIYPLTEGLPQRWLRSLVWRALNQFEHHGRQHRDDAQQGCSPRRDFMWLNRRKHATRIKYRRRLRR